jgi:hypothetical protein
LHDANADSFEKAVVVNTNVGGENCHRGAALGALMGAAVGEKAIPASLIEVSGAANLLLRIGAKGWDAAQVTSATVVHTGREGHPCLSD